MAARDSMLGSEINSFTKCNYFAYRNKIIIKPTPIPFQLQQKTFFLSRSQLLEPRNSSTIMAYERYATELAIHMGADPATAEAEMEAMVDWEIAMAPVSRSYSLL